MTLNIFVTLEVQLTTLFQPNFPFQHFLGGSGWEGQINGQTDFFWEILFCILFGLIIRTNTLYIAIKPQKEVSGQVELGVQGVLQHPQYFLKESKKWHLVPPILLDCKSNMPK